MGTMVQIGAAYHGSARVQRGAAVLLVGSSRIGCHSYCCSTTDQDQVQVGLAEALDTIYQIVRTEILNRSIRGICKLVEFGIVIGNNYVCCYNGTKIETCKKRSMAINKRDTVHEEVDNILSAESEYDPVFKNEEKFKEALTKSRVKEVRENNLSINLKLYSMI
ncbi:unnamed protein product [Rhizophagus irregularis]|nr:unnamed protein product [Rhizophagus irregularis]